MGVLTQAMDPEYVDMKRGSESFWLNAYIGFVG